MDLSGDVFLAIVGFLVLFVGAAVFWWMDHRAERQPHIAIGNELADLPGATLRLRAVRARNGALVDFTCLSMNPAAELLLGARAVDLVGHSLLRQVPAFDTSDHFPAYAAFVERGLPPIVHTRFTSKSGERWFHRSVNRVGEDLVLLLHDMTTERKHDLAQRTADQLAVLAATMRVAAHDIRNPLTNLNLVEDFLRSELSGKAELTPYLDMLRRNLDMIRAVADRMVSMNAPPALELLPGDLNELVRSVVADSRELSSSKGVLLREELASGRASVELAGGSLQLALMHLLHTLMNAIPRGSTVHVRTVVHRNEVILELSAPDCPFTTDQRTHMLIETYKAFPHGQTGSFSHAHSILLAHGTVLQSEVAKGEVRMHIEFVRSV